MCAVAQAAACVVVVVAPGPKRAARSGPTMTTTLAPVVLDTGADDAAGSMLVAGRVRAVATACTSGVAPPTVKISVADLHQCVRRRQGAVSGGGEKARHVTGHPVRSGAVGHQDVDAGRGDGGRRRRGRGVTVLLGPVPAGTTVVVVVAAVLARPAGAPGWRRAAGAPRSPRRRPRWPRRDLTGRDRVAPGSRPGGRRETRCRRRRRSSAWVLPFGGAALVASASALHPAPAQTADEEGKVFESDAAVGSSASCR